MNKKVPITRLGKFFGEDDFALDQELGKEWLDGDMNFKLILYRVDRYKTKNDDVYGESTKDGVKFLPPVEFNAYVDVLPSENKFIGSSLVAQTEPGNMQFWVYESTLEELNIEINFGDYIAYYETETNVRYYTVNNDGRVNSSNDHTYGGYKPFYRSYAASPVTNNEFRGL